jgi:hypothetical protein
MGHTLATSIWARAMTGRAERGTEQVDVLVNSVASNGGEAELLNELAADVDDLALQGTDGEGLLAGSLEVLCGNTLVSHCGVAGVRLQPYLPGQHRPL